MTNGERFKGAKERAEAFKRFCEKSQCYNCVLREQCNLNNTDVAFYWLDLEAPAEEPLPCPFCGSKCRFDYTAGEMKDEAAVFCDSCGYVSAHGKYDNTKPTETYKESAIAAHNRVARAAAMEKEANK